MLFYQTSITLVWAINVELHSIIRCLCYVSRTAAKLPNVFIYQDQGWVLSPAYDINPVSSSTGLHLNISEYDNSLDFNLAMEVLDYFRLAEDEAIEIKNEVLDSVKNWKKVASSIGISRQEQQLMTPAFNIE